MIVTADLHLENWLLFARPIVDGANNRLLESLYALRDIFVLATTLNEKVLVFAGDWFDRWWAIQTTVGAITTNELYIMLEQWGGTLYMVVGNHDMNNKRSARTHTLMAFGGHPQIHIVDQPSMLEIEGNPIALVPYHKDPAWVVEAFHTLSLAGARWAIGHLDLIGGMWNDGKAADRGIPLKEFALYAGGSFGHYHMPQKFDLDGRSFFYVGSPLQTSFEDEGQVKGVVQIRPNLTSQFIPLPQSVQFHTVTGSAEWDFTDVGDAKHYVHVICPMVDSDRLRQFYTAQGIDFVLSAIKNDGPQSPSMIAPLRVADPIFHYAKTATTELDTERLVEVANQYLEGR